MIKKHNGNSAFVILAVILVAGFVCGGFLTSQGARLKFSLPLAIAMDLVLISLMVAAHIYNLKTLKQKSNKRHLD